MLWEATHPTLLHPYLWLPDDDLARFPFLDEVPEGLVWHSGAVGQAVGEFITNDEGQCLAYHFPWFARIAQGCLVQSVQLNRRAYHGGRGNCWWGAAMPGPYDLDPRPDIQKVQAQGLVMALRQAFGPDHPRYWCRHSDYDAIKKDPGPGFKAEWMDEVGLEWKLPPGCKLVSD
jgi:hypothetical protein